MTVLRAQATKERGVGSTPGIFLYALANGGNSKGNSWNWVDVRDVALLHVLSLSTPEAGGERILGTAGARFPHILLTNSRLTKHSDVGTFSWQAVYDVLHDAGFKNIPLKETYGKGKPVTTGIQDNTKSLKIFPSFAYRPLSESTRDMAEALAKGGFLQ